MKIKSIMFLPGLQVQAPEIWSHLPPLTQLHVMEQLLPYIPSSHAVTF